MKIISLLIPIMKISLKNIKPTTDVTMHPPAHTIPPSVATLTNDSTLSTA